MSQNQSDDIANLQEHIIKLETLLDEIQGHVADYQNEKGIGTMDDKQWQQAFVDRVTGTITEYETNHQIALKQ